VAKATTATYAAGLYTWQAFADNGTERYLLDSGTLKVLPDYAAGTITAALDDRTHARKVLTAIEAILENRATKDQEEYTIAGRSLKRTPIPDLIVLRDTYRREANAEKIAEQIANGGANPRRMGIRFVRL